MNVPKTDIDLEALLYALTQQSEPMPEPLQRSLQAAGQALQQHQPDAAHQLRELIRQHPPLESSYKATLEQWDEQYASQQRTKSLSTTFQSASGLQWLFIHDVMPAPDWIAAAKQAAHPQQSTASSFWDKADRVAVVIAGGIALGSAIGQIPGAIVGGTLAAAYGWYISVAKTKSVRNP